MSTGINLEEKEVKVSIQEGSIGSSLNSGSNIGNSASQKIIRERIEESKKKLKFQKWLLALQLCYVSVTVISVSIKMAYNHSLNSIQRVELHINEYSNILRPMGALYRDSIKSIIDNNIEYDDSRLIRKRLFHQYQSRLTERQLIDNINQLMPIYEESMHVYYTMTKLMPV